VEIPEENSKTRNGNIYQGW